MTPDILAAIRLLEIVEKCAAHSPRLANLQGWAFRCLLEINEDIKTAATQPAQVVKPDVKPKPVDEDSHVIDPNLGAERLPERRI